MQCAVGLAPGANILLQGFTLFFVEGWLCLALLGGAQDPVVVQVVKLPNRGGHGRIVREAQAQVWCRIVAQLPRAQHTLEDGQYVVHFRIAVGFEFFYQLEVNVELVQILLRVLRENLFQQSADFRHALVAETQVNRETATTELGKFFTRADVRGQHGFFDHALGSSALLLLDTLDLALVVENQFVVRTVLHHQ